MTQSFGSSPAQPPLPTDLGLRTIAEAGAVLAPYFRQNDDPTLDTQRVDARGDVETVSVAGQKRIAVEELTRLLREGSRLAKGREAMGLPPETMSPIFPVQGDWFLNPLQWQADAFFGAMYGQVERQFPKSLDPEIIDDPVLSHLRQLDKAARGPFKPSWRPELSIAAEFTPEMKALIAAPAPSQTPPFPVTMDTSAFKNMGEFYLASRLIIFTRSVLWRRQNIALGGPQGLAALYASNEAYLSIVAEAMTEMSGTAVAVSKTLPQCDPAKASLPFVWTELTVSNNLVMEAAGTNAARLAALAF